jgi:hypothetical protein
MNDQEVDGQLLNGAFDPGLQPSLTGPTIVWISLVEFIPTRVSSLKVPNRSSFGLLYICISETFWLSCRTRSSRGIPPALPTNVFNIVDRHEDRKGGATSC